MYGSKRLIEFGMCDSAGILFFAKIFELSHSVYEEFLLDAGLHFNYFRHNSLAVPLISTSADFKNPIFLHETLQINLSVTRIGTTSFSLKFEFVGLNNKLKAEVTTTHVFVDKTDFEKRNIPEEFSELLQRHL